MSGTANAISLRRSLDITVFRIRAVSISELGYDREIRTSSTPPHPNVELTGVEAYHQDPENVCYVVNVGVSDVCFPGYEY